LLVLEVLELVYLLRQLLVEQVLLIALLQLVAVEVLLVVEALLLVLPLVAQVVVVDLLLFFLLAALEQQVKETLAVIQLAQVGITHQVVEEALALLVNLLQILPHLAVMAALGCHHPSAELQLFMLAVAVDVLA
jgi:hypothetical protein